MVRLFEGAWLHKKFVFAFLLFSVVFWWFLYGLQFVLFEEIGISYALIRSFAFAAAFFISLALFLSTLFKWRLTWNRYWPLRRSLGVMGVTFAILHVLFVLSGVFQGNWLLVFFSWNPLVNPLIFGVVGIVVLGVVALVSNDWAQAKLGGQRWKNIQRLVYLGYWGVVFHILTVNPMVLQNPVGYLLGLLIGATLLGELVWFFKAITAKRATTKAILVGIGLILLYLVTAALLGFQSLWPF